MRVLIDITHPAHLHFFRHAIAKLRSEGRQVLLTARDKDCLRRLAERMKLDLVFFGGTPSTLAGMAGSLAYRKLRLLRTVRRFRPDVMAGIGGTYIGLLGKFVGVPTVVFTDTEAARLANRITFPFATRICTPHCYRDDLGPRHERYHGYHELAYLAPQYFQPDASIGERLGLKPGERLAILRFVRWKASHDIGLRGLSDRQKQDVAESLSAQARVLISSEDPLPPALERYRYPLPADTMHDAIARSSLVFGESSTMCSEAAVLGVPSIFLHPPDIGRGYTQEQIERWGIVHWFPPREHQAAIAEAARILAAPPAEYQQAARNMLEACTDVTSYICQQLQAVAATAEANRNQVA